ncbi:hypothetical protein GCM10027519_25540 [Kineococcus endophyticus]
MDGADEVVAGDEGEPRLVVVAAPAHLLLGERDAAGLDRDEGLAGTGDGHVGAFDAQALGLDDAGEDDTGGGHGNSW